MGTAVEKIKKKKDGAAKLPSFFFLIYQFLFHIHRYQIKLDNLGHRIVTSQHVSTLLQFQSLPMDPVIL